MKDQARAIIDDMSDLQATRFLEHFGRELFKGTDRGAILSGVREDVAALEQVRRIRSLDTRERHVRLTREDSAAMARRVLEVLASDQSMAPAIVAAWEGYAPDELFVETILASGFVAALILFLATTEIEGTVMGVHFKKGVAEPDQIRAITEPFFAALDQQRGR